MESKTKGYKTVDVATPLSGRLLMTDCYWLCRDGDPKQAIFFNDTAQCNKHKSIPERMIEFTERRTGWSVGVVFVPFAYRPQIPRW